MDSKKAKLIGGKEGAIAVTIGLILSHTAMSILSFDESDGIFKAVFWFENTNILNLILSIIVIYLCGFFFGQSAGRQVLFKHKNYLMVCFKFGIYTLFTTAFLSGIISFFQFGIEKVGEREAHPLLDYFLVTMYWEILIGMIPAILMSGFLGYRIRKRQKF